jgi:ribosomal protein L29
LPIIRLDEVREMTSEQRIQKLTELKTELSKIRTLKGRRVCENPGGQS